MRPGSEAPDTGRERAPPVKATIAHLETLESLVVLWNPESYRVERAQQLAAPIVPGAAATPPQFVAGVCERFRTTLLLDASSEEGAARDVRRWSDRLAGWARPEPRTGLPPLVVFLWGTFRFRGRLERIDEEWVRFDPDGVPVRAWVGVCLRRE